MAEAKTPAAAKANNKPPQPSQHLLQYANNVIHDTPEVREAWLGAMMNLSVTTIASTMSWNTPHRAVPRVVIASWSPDSPQAHERWPSVSWGRTLEQRLTIAGVRVDRMDGGATSADATRLSAPPKVDGISAGLPLLVILGTPQAPEVGAFKRLFTKGRLAACAAAVETLEEQRLVMRLSTGGEGQSFWPSTDLTSCDGLELRRHEEDYWSSAPRLMSLAEATFGVLHRVFARGGLPLTAITAAAFRINVAAQASALALHQAFFGDPMDHGPLHAALEARRDTEQRLATCQHELEAAHSGLAASWEELANARDCLEKQVRRREAAEATIEARTSTIVDLQARVDALRRHCEEWETENTTLRGSLGATRTELQETEEQLRKTRETLSMKLTLLESRARESEAEHRRALERVAKNHPNVGT